MSKLPEAYRFFDVSDYGRSSARWIANHVKHTSITSIHLTSLFILSGLLSIICMLNGYYIAAGFLLILKSILDAADGELARIKQQPSYVGRYYDSIADILLNFLFLLVICYIAEGHWSWMLLAFLSIQLQGTLYNYYYVILRNSVHGDTTSRIFEDSPPKAFPGEKQQQVNLYFHIYNGLYYIFDKTIYLLDKNAADSPPFPKWFMTLLSTFGLGFQLLIMALLLGFNQESYILPFFVLYGSLIFVFIGIRKTILQ